MNVFSSLREQSDFQGNGLVYFYRAASCYPAQYKTSFPHFVQSYQLSLVFIERAHCTRDSGVAHIASSDRQLREQRDQEGHNSHGRNVCRSRTCGSERGRKAWFYR